MVCVGVCVVYAVGREVSATRRERVPWYPVGGPGLRNMLLLGPRCEQVPADSRHRWPRLVRLASSFLLCETRPRCCDWYSPEGRQVFCSRYLR